jgi:hypothetical protein
MAFKNREWAERAQTEIGFEFNYHLGLAALAFILFKLSGLSVLYDWYVTSRFVKRSNFRRRFERPFGDHFKSDEAIANHAQALDTEHLLWALKLGDHTVRAKSLITAELHRRQLSDLQISNWMPQAGQITSICCAAVPSSTAQYRRLERRRRRFFMVYRLLALPLILAAFLSNCTLGSQPIPGAEDVGWIFVFLMMLVSCLAVFTGRRRSLRFLLLRPFGEPKLAPALRNVVAEHLGPISATYTLSDRAYRPGFFLALFERCNDLWRFALGALYRPSRLLMSVKNEGSFLNLARILSNVIGPSFKTFAVGDQALRIRATDDWWQLVIDMLMHSVDLIVMDISNVGSGSTWEILQLSKRRLQGNCMFICEEGYDQRGLDCLRRVDPGFDPYRLYIYTADGRFENSSGFDSRMGILLDLALRKRKKPSSGI